MSEFLREAIDISEHNIRGKRPIDWVAVKASGVSAVMIRIGWAGFDGMIAKNNAVDESLDASVRGASAAGLDVGLYVYTYTKNAAAARVAARECVEIARRYPGVINYPIAFDVEETQLDALTGQGKAGLTETVAAFCSEVTKLGYYPCWYTYTAFARANLDVTALTKYSLWIADYRGNESLMKSQIGTEYGMWQYAGDTGRCPGVEGACDRNRVYQNYPSIIRAAGLNGLGEKLPTEDCVPRKEYEVLQAKLEAANKELTMLRQKAEKYDKIKAITG